MDSEDDPSVGAPETKETNPLRAWSVGQLSIVLFLDPLPSLPHEPLLSNQCCCIGPSWPWSIISLLIGPCSQPRGFCLLHRRSFICLKMGWQGNFDSYWPLVGVGNFGCVCCYVSRACGSISQFGWVWSKL